MYIIINFVAYGKYVYDIQNVGPYDIWTIVWKYIHHFENTEHYVSSYPFPIPNGHNNVILQYINMNLYYIVLIVINSMIIILTHSLKWSYCPRLWNYYLTFCHLYWQKYYTNRLNVLNLEKILPLEFHLIEMCLRIFQSKQIIGSWYSIRKKNHTDQRILKIE